MVSSGDNPSNPFLFLVFVILVGLKFVSSTFSVSKFLFLSRRELLLFKFRPLGVSGGVP